MGSWTDAIVELRDKLTGSSPSAILVESGPQTTGSASTPATAAVTSSSASAVAANAARQGMVLVNIGTTDVFLGLGKAAVNNSGVCVKGNGGAWDGLISGVLWTGEVLAKTASGTSTLSVQEI